VAALRRCGILAHGFARVHCDDCGRDDVVAFSCKGRGFCPSCGSRRMADQAAWLVDRVLPEVPYRQWVLSLPYRVRFLCAYDPWVCSGVRRILLRAVSGYYLRAARVAGQPRPRIGAVAFEQRFDSGLRVNLHWHVVWADGVFASAPHSGRAEFCAHPEVTDAAVVQLVTVIRDRVVRFLRRLGKLPADAPADDPAARAPELQEELGAAAIAGRTALGERAGARDERIGRGTRAAPFVKGPLCADCDGFSLNAAVRLPAFARERLEKLCRYAARPPIAEERLSLLPDGRVSYALKKRWRDGTTHVVLEPQVLLERLCALVPRPRRHLVTYHGVFAPAAGYRPWVVPSGAAAAERVAGAASAATGAEGAECGQEPGASGWAGIRRRRPVVPHAPRKLRRPRSKYSWAELMRRVYAIDVLVCPSCGGARRLLAAVHDPEAIRRILVAMGLPVEPPARSPPRGVMEERWLPW
jgi:hypothetical protein